MPPRAEAKLVSSLLDKDSAQATLQFLGWSEEHRGQSPTPNHPLSFPRCCEGFFTSLAECLQDLSTRILSSNQVCSRTQMESRKGGGGISAFPSPCSGCQRGSADTGSV